MVIIDGKENGKEKQKRLSLKCHHTVYDERRVHGVNVAKKFNEIVTTKTHRNVEEELHQVILNSAQQCKNTMLSLHNLRQQLKTKRVFFFLQY